MNEETVADLTTTVKRVDGDDDVRAATLLGNGPVIYAGFQLEMIHEKDVDEQKEF